MHNNYYLLRQLSRQLAEELIGFSCMQIFTQAKGELVIELCKAHQVRFIKAHLTPWFCCLSFPEQFSRARKNSTDLFHEIIDVSIANVVQVPNDRSFYFEMSNEDRLIFKMHGNRSNILLCQGGKVTNLFRSNLVSDRNIDIRQLAKKINFDEKALKIHGGDYRKLLPTLGKAVQPYLSKCGYEQLDDHEKYQCLSDLLMTLENPKFYIHSGEAGLPVFSLFTLGNEDQVFDRPVAAINVFFNSYLSKYKLVHTRKTVSANIRSQIKKTENYLKVVEKKLASLDNEASYRNMGDLIMANLHQIKPHQTEVELLDFYSGKPIIIPLKSMLSPQKNAEKFYHKAKKQQIEVEKFKLQVKRKKKSLADLQEKLKETASIVDYKLLDKAVKRDKKTKDLPYRHILFMDYEILVGRNARRNEELTFGVARKDDCFVHAKDTPGSHVIIRKKSNQNIPKPVLQAAASLAAYYSKSKGIALCRVLYTSRKYVRKAKGMPAGTVIVDREKIVLASPKGLDTFVKI